MSLAWTNASHFHEYDPPEIRWVVEGFCAIGAVTVLVGDPGIGKSYVAMSMASAVAVGLPVLGMPTRIGGVAILDAENGTEELHRRSVALGLRGNAVVAVAPGGFDLANSMYELEDVCSPATTKMLVIDGFRSSFPSTDENDSASVSSVMAALQQVARQYEVAIVLLHHRSKAGTLRGSNAFQSTAEFVVHMVSDKGSLYLAWEKSRMGRKPSKKYLALTAHGAVEA